MSIFTTTFLSSQKLMNFFFNFILLFMYLFIHLFIYLFIIDILPYLNLPIFQGPQWK